MNPCMKKLFSGEMPMSSIWKFISAFMILGIQSISMDAASMSSIFERFIFLASMSVSVKIFMQITS